MKKSKDTEDGDERREESVLKDGACWVFMAVARRPQKPTTSQEQGGQTSSSIL